MTRSTEPKFFGKQIGETKWPADMAEMVTFWIGAWSGYDQDDRGWAITLIDELREINPDLCVDFILDVLRREPPANIAGQLAAGPLEDLLIHHGAAVIDRVEVEARRNPKFRELFDGIYTTGIPEEIRRRADQLISRRC